MNLIDGFEGLTVIASAHCTAGSTTATAVLAAERAAASAGASARASWRRRRPTARRSRLSLSLSLSLRCRPVRSEAGARSARSQLRFVVSEQEHRRGRRTPARSRTGAPRPTPLCSGASSDLCILASSPRSACAARNFEREQRVESCGEQSASASASPGPGGRFDRPPLAPCVDATPGTLFCVGQTQGTKQTCVARAPPRSSRPCPRRLAALLPSLSRLRRSPVPCSSSSLVPTRQFYLATYTPFIPSPSRPLRALPPPRLNFRRHAFVQDHPRLARPRGPLVLVGLGLVGPPQQRCVLPLPPSPSSSLNIRARRGRVAAGLPSSTAIDELGE